jgi:hypothetical protein
MKSFLRYLRESVEDVKSYIGTSPEDFKQGRVVPDHQLHSHAQTLNDTSKISSDQKRAISSWTSPPGYKQINGSLRSGGDTTQANHLSAAVSNNTLPSAAWGYRGLHGIHAEKFRNLKPGDTFHSKGFVSTTLDPNRSTHFSKGEDVLAVHVPKGSKGLYVSDPKLNSWQDERELLLPHGTHFRYKHSEQISVPEHHYSGEKTGRMSNITMHHVEMIEPSKHSMQLD